MASVSPHVRRYVFSNPLGDLIYLRVFGKGILLIGRAELAHEFLDKRSANTSDRASNPAMEL